MYSRFIIACFGDFPFWGANKVVFPFCLWWVIFLGPFLFCFLADCVSFPLWFLSWCITVFFNGYSLQKASNFLWVRELKGRRTECEGNRFSGGLMILCSNSSSQDWVLAGHCRATFWGWGTEKASCNSRVSFPHNLFWATTLAAMERSSISNPSIVRIHSKDYQKNIWLWV